jgi:hypothetical protein
MLFPFTRAWTRRQKWLIVIATAALTAVFCALVYTYERYYGLPTQDILIGTWEHPEGMIWDPPAYYEFHANHTLSHFVVYPDGREYRAVWGRWYAFGPNIYVMFPEGDEPRLMIWHIVDVSDDELRIWAVRPYYEETLKRVRLRAPKASNQAMERTAGSFES